MRVSIGDDLYSKVLIVDDDHAELRTLIDIFTEAGFEPVASADLEALGKQLSQGGLGIAVVDLKFAELSGADVIHLIRQTNSATRIIVYTGCGSYESAKEAVNLGAFAYVEKAGDFNELIAAVRRATNEVLVEALKSSEQTYRNLAEHIDAVFWMRSIKGRLLYVSPKCKQVWGMDSTAFRSNPQIMIEAIVDEDRPRVCQAIQQLISETHPANFDLEYRVRRPDGEIVWVRDRSFSVRDDEGTLIKHAGLAEDVTQSRSDVERLRILERAIAFADIGITICDAREQNSITYCNAAFEKLTGYTAEEMLGRNCRLLQGNDREQPGVGELQRAVAAGRETSVVVRNYRNDGTMFWNEVSISPVFDELDKLTHFVGFQKDISLRVEMEQKLRESEQRFRMIFEQAAVGVALIESQTGRFVRINQKYSSMIGYGVDEMVGKTFMEITVPDDLQEDLRNMETLKAGETSEFAMEKRLIRKDGSEIWVNLTVSPTWKLGESPTFHIAIVEDITSRKQMEQKLRETARSLAKAQGIAKIGSWEFNLNSGQISGSAEILRIFGLNDLDSIPGFESFVDDFVDPRDQKLVANSYFKALETGVPSPIEFRFFKAPGKEPRYGRCESEVVRDHNGVPQKIIGTLQDITEQKAAAEERARHLEELSHVARLSTMGEMVAGIAHELNQPLYSIANFSEACSNTLLKRRDLRTDGVLKWTEEISKQATRAGQIIQRLGDFVRKKRPRRSIVDVNELIRESAELLSFETRRHEILLEFMLHEPAPRVLADGIQLQQVIVNLLRNAYESILANNQARGRVIFTTLRDNGNVIVRIEDSGPGISPADVDRMFEPFYSTKQQGMGMGLAISRSILAAHNSTLAVRTGKVGTIFEFNLAVQNGD